MNHCCWGTPLRALSPSLYLSLLTMEMYKGIPLQLTRDWKSVKINAGNGGEIATNTRARQHTNTWQRLMVTAHTRTHTHARTRTYMHMYVVVHVHNIGFSRLVNSSTQYLTFFIDDDKKERVTNKFWNQFAFVRLLMLLVRTSRGLLLDGLLTTEQEHTEHTHQQQLQKKCC